jgi:hypothetical protein
MNKRVLQGCRVERQPFLELFNREGDFERVVDRIEHVVFQSFAQLDTAILGRVPEMTDAEVSRRVVICEKWFRIMRGDLGWGLIRTLDTLALALGHELVGIEFDPAQVDTSIGFASGDRAFAGLVSRIRM